MHRVLRSEDLCTNAWTCLTYFPHLYSQPKYSDHRLLKFWPASQAHRARSGPTRARCQASAAPVTKIDMATSVSGVMAKLREASKGAFVPFIMAGDPNLETTERALIALGEAGADVIELGVPYSDPLADGPTIQAACSRGLNSCTTLAKVLALVARVSPIIAAPIVLFQYYNPILRQGPDEYCRLAKEAGAKGLLVPDLCLEETDVIRAATRKAGLELTLLVTPTTPRERMQKIAAASEGFVYLVSVTGVTGGRTENSTRVQGLIKVLKEVTGDDKSIAVGFGVSTPTQAEELRNWGAEGVIVGSALVKALGEAESPEIGLEELTKLAKSLRTAI